MSKLEITHNAEHSLEGENGRVDYQMNYSQGDMAAMIQFSLICRNVPIGSVVGFSADKPGPVPPIYLPPTKVSTYPSFVTGMVSDVPANYEAVITFYAEFSSTPPADASIQLQAAYIVNP